MLQAARAPQPQPEEAPARGSPSGPLPHRGLPQRASPKSSPAGASRDQGAAIRDDLYTPRPLPPVRRFARQRAPPPFGGRGSWAPRSPPQPSPRTRRGELRPRRGGSTHRPRPPPRPRRPTPPAPRRHPPKDACSPGALWRLCQPSRILPASLEWKITASNFAEELVPAL